MMVGVEFMKPGTLFNLLNQDFKYPCISDPVFMLLLDARRRENYDESHIITAKFATWSEKRQFLISNDYELSCKTHVIVYDLNTSVVNSESRSFRCAQQMWKHGSRNQVKVLQGGYQLFSSMYPFLRTRKIIYLPRELDMFETYPCEIIRSQLYLGRRTHANMAYIQRDLNIDRHINCGVCPSILYPEAGRNIMAFAIKNTFDYTFYTKIQVFCDFIEIDYNSRGAVLVYSEYGTNRSAAVVVAYIIYIRMCSYESALALLKSLCPKVCICRKLADQLKVWARDIKTNPFAIKRRQLARASEESTESLEMESSTIVVCDEVASSACAMQTMKLREHKEEMEEEDDDDDDDDDDVKIIYRSVLTTMAAKNVIDAEGYEEKVENEKEEEEEEAEDEEEDEESLNVMPHEEVLIRNPDIKVRSENFVKRPAGGDYEEYVGEIEEEEEVEEEEEEEEVDKQVSEISVRGVILRSVYSSKAILKSSKNKVDNMSSDSKGVGGIEEETTDEKTDDDIEEEINEMTDEPN